MSTRKKYFPKKAKAGALRLKRQPLSASHMQFSNSAKKGKSLRIEFDNIIRKTYADIDDELLNQLWLHIGPQVLEDKGSSIKDIIDEFIGTE